MRGGEWLRLLLRQCVGFLKWTQSLIFFYCLFNGIVHLWVILSHKEIIDKSQDDQQDNDNYRTHETRYNLFQDEGRNNDGHEGEDIETGIGHW